MAETASSDDPLERAWDSLESRWEDPQAHRAYVNLASSLGRLPDAAKRYRALKADPARGAVAAQGIELILAAAMSQMTASTVGARPPPGLYLVPMVALLLLVGATLAASNVLGRAQLRSPVVLVCEVALVALVPWRRVLGGGR